MKKFLLAGVLLAAPSAYADQIPELTDQIKDEIHLISEGLKQVDPETGKTYGDIMNGPTTYGDYGMDSFRLRVLGRVKFGAFGFAFAVKPHIQLGWKN